MPGSCLGHSSSNDLSFRRKHLLLPPDSRVPYISVFWSNRILPFLPWPHLCSPQLAEKYSAFAKHETQWAQDSHRQQAKPEVQGTAGQTAYSSAPEVLPGGSASAMLQKQISSCGNSRSSCCFSTLQIHKKATSAALTGALAGCTDTEELALQCALTSTLGPTSRVACVCRMCDHTSPGSFQDGPLASDLLHGLHSQAPASQPPHWMQG